MKYQIALNLLIIDYKQAKYSYMLQTLKIHLVELIICTKTFKLH